MKAPGQWRLLGLALLTLASALAGCGDASPRPDGQTGRLMPPLIAATGSEPPHTPTPAAYPTAPPSLMDAALARTRHFKGRADAPVTIVEFSDFQ